MDAVQQLAQPCEAVLERFHVDTRYIAAKAPDSFPGKLSATAATGGCGATCATNSAWSGPCPRTTRIIWTSPHHPLADATMPTLPSYPFPKGDDPSRFAGLRERALRDAEGNAIRRGIGNQRRRV